MLACLFTAALGFVFDALGTARALDPQRVLTQYGHTAWRLQDGELPAPAYPIAQTKDGYLWIGTQAGAVRFDGVRFVPLDELSSAKLADPFVLSLLGASDGSLWISHSVGISHWDGERLTNYPDALGTSYSLAEDGAGRIWFLTQSAEGKALCEVIGKGIKCRGKADGLVVPDKCCSPTMTTDGHGTFWLGTDDDVVRWREGETSSTFTLDAKAKGGVTSNILITMEPSGNLLVGVSAHGPGLGLQRLVDGTWQPFNTPQVDGSTLAVQAMRRDSHGALWVGTIDSGIYRIVGERVDHFDSKQGLSSDCIYYFYEDAAGSMWVATSMGIDRFRDLRVASYTPREGVAVDEVDGVLAARDGKVWFGTAISLDVLENGRVRSIGAAQGLPGSQVTALLEDAAGRLWVGVDNTLNIHVDGRFDPVPGLDGAPIGFVIALAQDQAGDVWASLRVEPRKVVRIRDDRAVEEYPEAVLPRVAAMAADPREGVWFSLRDGSIVHRHHNATETFATGLVDMPVRKLLMATDGTLYGASDKGLVVLRGSVSRILDSSQGLPCDIVHSAIEDQDRALWLQTGCGIVRLDPAEVERGLRDSRHVMQVEVLDVLDGVRGGVAPFSRAARTPDGRLWFANGVNLQTIDPRATVAARVPPVYIERLVADRKVHALADRVTLPALTRDVEIDYTATELAIPQRVRFRYRLEGHDVDWTEADTRRQAFYTNLPPGDYEFRVAASAGAGIWQQAGRTLRFAIAPTFYQTRWFLALVVAAAIAALWMTFAWRLARVKAQMRARHDERLQERERIARELHDTFLQGVQGLMLRFQSAMERIPSSQPARELMETALDHADAVIADGRDRVTQLRTQHQTAGDLPGALQIVGEELARGGPVAFALTVEGARRELDPVVWDEIQRIACEALTNAFRHAQAKRIDVGVTYASRHLTVSVVDDGRGFDVDTVGKHGPAGHWGLKGMQERAAKIRGRLQMASGPGIGTSVELTVPATIAFSRSVTAGRAWLRRLRRALGFVTPAAPAARNDDNTE